MWLILAWLILSATIGPISWAGHAGELSSSRSFQIGEELTYDISWLNITAGTAVMAIDDAAADGTRPLV
ncbi:MAG TPA: hypothetical protein VJU02_01085, partial [Nitrospiraceae bacterium]|nr:hypothetical protein [Nitrospiraceae bacterium]